MGRTGHNQKPPKGQRGPDPTGITRSKQVEILRCWTVNLISQWQIFDGKNWKHSPCLLILVPRVKLRSMQGGPHFNSYNLVYACMFITNLAGVILIPAIWGEFTQLISAGGLAPCTNLSINLNMWFHPVSSSTALFHWSNQACSNIGCLLWPLLVAHSTEQVRFNSLGIAGPTHNIHFGLWSFFIVWLANIRSRVHHC